jgi:hypothetical protein
VALYGFRYVFDPIEIVVKKALLGSLARFF